MSDTMVSRVTVRVEYWSLFDGWDMAGVDADASRERFVTALTAQLASRYPTATIDVDIAQPNELSRDQIEVRYADGRWVDDDDAELLNVREAIGQVYGDMGWAVVEEA